MPAVNLILNASKENVSKPIIWRLGKLFNVVTNILRAQVTEEYAQISLAMEGSTEELEQAVNYLHSIGVIKEGIESAALRNLSAPEDIVARPITVHLTLETSNPVQAGSPILLRISKDFQIVLDITRASFDSQAGGTIEMDISGKLTEVQRAIAYLHTTGLHVNPVQRCVTDYSNL